MKWLADENIPLQTINLLRNKNIDVTAVQQVGAGMSDPRVLQLSVAEQRALLTFDRDFGELIFRRHLPSPPAVVYLRFVPTTPSEPAEVLLHLLGKANLEGCLIVLDRDGYRKRSLPGSAESPSQGK